MKRKHAIILTCLVLLCLSFGVAIASSQGYTECYEECSAYGGHIVTHTQINTWQISCGSGVYCNFGSNSFECREMAAAIGDGVVCFYAVDASSKLGKKIVEQQSAAKSAPASH
jgi:hypothetical protein